MLFFKTRYSTTQVSKIQVPAGTGTGGPVGSPPGLEISSSRSPSLVADCLVVDSLKSELFTFPGVFPLKLEDPLLDFENGLIALPEEIVAVNLFFL